MDGVIVDSEGYQFESFKELFSPYGVNLSKDNFNWVGKTSRDNIQNVVEKNDIKEELEVLRERKGKIYAELIKDNITPMQGAVELINSLSKKYILAIASSSVIKNVEMILNGLHIRDKFEVIVSGDQVQKGKPDPEIFLKALEKLKLQPDECLVIEDAQTGVEAAHKAGIKCITVPNQYTKNQDFSKATKIINSLTELKIENIDEL